MMPKSSKFCHGCRGTANFAH